MAAQPEEAAADTRPAPVPVRVEAASGEAEAPVVMAPFDVVTERDEGFVAASSLAGGRIAGDLKDTPVAYSVMTKDFIDALGLTDLSEMVQWMPNAYELPDNNESYATGGTPSISARGITTSTPQRNFFPINYNFDAYNVERLDFARGPNAILFGATGLGGTANSFTKRARLDRRFGEVKASLGSWDNYRVTLDYNQPLIHRTLGLRLNGLYQDSAGWQDTAEQRREGATLAATWKPFYRTEIRGEAEIGSRRNAIIVTNVNDYFSAWDGVASIAASIPSTDTAAIAALAPLGLARLGRTIVYNPSISDGTLTNFEGWGRTQGGNTNTVTPAGGVYVVGPTANISNRSILQAKNLPSSLYDAAIANSNFRMPGRSFSTSPNDLFFEVDNQEYSLSVSQQLGPRIFMELAANYGHTKSVSNISISRQISRMYIDINEYIPSAADSTQVVPNPNYLEPYGEAYSDPIERFQDRLNARLTLAYVFNRTPWGDFTLNAIAGTSYKEEDQNAYRYALKIGANPAAWLRSYPVNYRYYLFKEDDRPMPTPDTWTYVNPTDGTVSTVDAGFVRDNYTNTSFNRVTNITYNYFQSTLSGKMLKGRLNVLAAVRIDHYDSEIKDPLAHWDNASDWDAVSRVFKPAAPSDYTSLTYQYINPSTRQPEGPMLPADVRPRDSNGRQTGNPYALYKDYRFQDDFSPPAQKDVVTTYTAGGVFHVTDKVSAFVNYAESFTPPSSAIKIDGSLFVAPKSSGWDYGLRFTLLDGRFVANIIRYQGQEDGKSMGSAPYSTSLQAILRANSMYVIPGDPSSGINDSTSASNGRGLSAVPQGYSDSSDVSTKGWELDITANITRNWRLRLNAAIPIATQDNPNRESVEYIQRNFDTLRQIMLDAGAVVDENNVASRGVLPPGLPQTPNRDELDNAVTRWNEMMAALGSRADGQKVNRLLDFSGNIYTDYTFRRGALRGLRLGMGANYRGKQIIGYKGSDTIVDPDNPSVAIDDPAVNGFDYVYADAYTVATLAANYTTRILKKYTLVVDFRINNLFNYDKPIYINTVMRPRDGDLSTPARVATPHQFAWVTPRSFLVTATVKF